MATTLGGGIYSVSRKLLGVLFHAATALDRAPVPEPRSGGVRYYSVGSNYVRLVYKGYKHFL